MGTYCVSVEPMFRTHSHSPSQKIRPSDYHLFRAMANILHGRRFDNLEQVEAGSREFFNSKDKEWYRSVIKQLIDGWL